MENNEPQNPTQSEPQLPAPSDEFEKVMQLLADLPTDRALRDLGKTRSTPAIQKVVEVMAISKLDLVRSLRLMRARENTLRHHIKVLTQVDEVVADYMKTHPNFDVEIVSK